MGVLISPLDVPTAEFVTLACWGDDPKRSVPAAAFENEAAAHTATCAECASYNGPCRFDEVPYPTMSITASSFMAIMEELGYELGDPWGGVASADELKALIDKRADALSPRAQAMAGVVDWALDHGTAVRWS